MIRQSSSFFISLTVHSLVAVLLFFTYKNIVSFKSDKNEKIKLKLSSVVEEKKVPNIIQEPKIIEEPKKILKPIPKKIKPIKSKPIKKIVPTTEKKVKKEKPLKQVQEVYVPLKEVLTTHEEKVSVEELNPEVEYLDENIKEITKLIQENLYYPRSARRRNITGKVVVEFILSTDSTVKNVKINSSINDTLSHAAIKTIKNLSGKFPKPKEELILKVPIIYSLSH